MEVVLRAIVVYLLLLLIFRMSGRRTMAQMTSFDLVMVLIVAETTQQALVGSDYSITGAMLAITTLFSLDIGLSYLKRHLPNASRVLDGVPTILVREGKANEHALRRSRVELEEILEAARSTQGLSALDEIEFAILEVDGKISIIPRRRN